MGSVTMAKTVGKLWALSLLAAAVGQPGCRTADVEVADASEQFSVPGSTLTVALFEHQGGPSSDSFQYRVAWNGKDFGSTHHSSSQLLVRDSALLREPAALADSLPSSANARLFLIQFKTPLLAPYAQHLRQAGVQIQDHFPNNAVLAVLSPADQARVEKFSYVRAVRPYPAAWRLPVALHAALSSSESRPYTILTTELADIHALAARIERSGGLVDAAPKRGLLQVRLSGAALAWALNDDAVLSIDAWRQPEVDVDLARQTSGAEMAFTTLGYSGEGLRAEVMDGGVLDTHLDLQSRPTLFHRPNTTDKFHGTCTHGIVFGDGTKNPLYRGILPRAQPIFASYSGLTDRYKHTQELNEAPYFAVFQSNSWGGGRTLDYTNESAELDRTLFDTDVLLFQSQSNSGDRMSRPEAWAKNVVSIGAFNHMNTLDERDDNWKRSASIGPAADGRIKPDLSHFYDATEAPYHDGAYGDFGGTSGATPITAGHAGLMLQMWADGHFSRPTKRSDSGNRVFDLRPHSMTSKALMINTARQFAFTGENHDLTRVHQGWGRIDLVAMQQRRQAMWVLDEGDVIEPHQTRSYSIEVGPGSEALRVTMAFRDPAGVPSAQRARVNDLSLRVTSPSGTTYLGNNGLRQGVWSVPGGEADHIDTVENVFVAAPDAGRWVVEVEADEINQDGHPSTNSIDAVFALVVTGGRLIESPSTGGGSSGGTSATAGNTSSGGSSSGSSGGSSTGTAGTSSTGGNGGQVGGGSGSNPITHLLLSEVGYDTPGDDGIEEYVVVANPTPNTIDLAGYTLVDATSFSLTGQLAPGAVHVVARNAAGLFNWRSLTANQAGMTLQLGNNGDTLNLHGPAGELVDHVEWETIGWPIAANRGSVLRRKDLASDSDTFADWAVIQP